MRTVKRRTRSILPRSSLIWSGVMRASRAMARSCDGLRVARAIKVRFGAERHSVRAARAAVTCPSPGGTSSRTARSSGDSWPVESMS